MAQSYEVTVTNTGSVIVEANNKDEAYNKVLEMSNEEIEKKGNFASWEPSDVAEVSYE